MLCEENMTATKARSALSIPQSTKHVTTMKTHSNARKTNKHCTNYGMANHNVETWRKKKKNHGGNHKGIITKSKTTKYFFICMPHLWIEWT
jgi:hypothetical protein